MICWGWAGIRIIISLRILKELYPKQYFYHILFFSAGACRSNETSSLSDFAQHVLKQICSQEWVLERCLQNPEELCKPDMLLDNELTPRQAQRLLHMICYPNSTLDNNLDQRTLISRILEVRNFNMTYQKKNFHIRLGLYFSKSYLLNYKFVSLCCRAWICGP